MRCDSSRWWRRPHRPPQLSYRGRAMLRSGRWRRRPHRRWVCCEPLGRDQLADHEDRSAVDVTALEPASNFTDHNHLHLRLLWPIGYATDIAWPSAPTVREPTSCFRAVQSAESPPPPVSQSPGNDDIAGAIRLWWAHGRVHMHASVQEATMKIFLQSRRETRWRYLIRIDEETESSS